MRKKTYLQDKELSDDEKNVIRSLYFENRLLLEDVADLLGSMEAARVYELKSSIESENEVPEPSFSGSFKGTEDSLDDIPDEVLDELDEDNVEEY